MAKPWSEITQSKEYSELSSEDKVRAQQMYYDNVVVQNPTYTNLSDGDKRRATNLFFGVQQNTLSNIGSANAAEEDISESINVLSESEISSLKKKGPIGWWEAAGRQHKADLIPFSPTGVVRSGSILKTVNRLKSDEYDSQFDRQRDQDAIRSFLSKLEEERVRDFTFGAKVYKGVSNLPGFMIEFALTGGWAALGKGAVVRGAGKLAEKGVGKIATAVAGTTAGAATRGIVMYNRYLPKYAERQIFANVAITDKGEALLVESQEAPFTSFMKAFGDVVIENVSEQSGAALTKGFKVVGAGLGKAVPKKLGTELMKAYRKIRPSGKVTELFTRAGYHNFLEEMGEERVGDLIRAVTGVTVAPGQEVGLFDRLVQSVPDAEQLLVEAGVFSVPGVTNYTTQRMYNKMVKRGDKVSVKEVDEQLSQIEKEKIDDDLTNPEDIKTLVTEKEIDAEIKREESLDAAQEAGEEIDAQAIEDAVSGSREFNNKIAQEEVLPKAEEQELVGEVKTVTNQLKKIQDKVTQLEEKGEKVPESLVKRQSAALGALKQLGVSEKAIRAKGVSPARLLGQFDKNITISEAKALRRLVRAEAKAAGAAATTARKAERVRLTTLFKEKATTAASVKNDLVKYVKQNIPLRDSLGKPINDRGKLISLVEKTKTKAGLQKAFERVDVQLKQIQRENTMKEIKADTKKALNSGKISVDYRTQVEELVSLVDFTKPSKKKIKQLQSLKEWVTRSLSEGKDVKLPLSVFNRLERLFKIPLANMSLSELKLLQKDIEDLVAYGKLKQLTRKRLMLLSQQRILNDLAAQGTNDIHTIEQTLPALGETLSSRQKARNAVNKAVGLGQHLGEAVTSMDFFFDFLDDSGEYSGVLYTNFKERIDFDTGSYLAQKHELTDEVMRYVTEHDMQEGSFLRVGVYAISKQDKGVAKLLNSGVTQKEIDSLDLTSVEMGLYRLMRKRLDELAPQIKDMLDKVYNRPFHKVKNYFSYLTDYDSMASAQVKGNYSETELLLDMVTGNNKEFGQESKNPNLVFIEKRSQDSKQKIRVNALDVYLRHIDHAAYAIHLSASLKLLNNVARDKQMTALIGDKGQQYLINWLTAVARKGMSGEDPIIDAIRRNISKSQFAFKISTAVLQSTAVMDGAAVIGTWAFRGMKNIVYKQNRQFIIDHFPEIRERIGGDFELTEFLKFGSGSKLDKLTMKGFFALKKMDGLTASSVGFGAYSQYIHDNGLVLDLNAPDPKGVAYAQRVVRMTQASALAKDLPPAMVSKQLTGSVSWNRALLQFQTFMLNRWSLFRHHGVRYGINNRDIGQFAQVSLWLMVANIGEYGIRTIGRGTAKELVGWVSGTDPEEDEEDIAYGMFMTMLGNIPYVSMGVSLFGYGSNPIPAFDIMADMADAVKKAQQSATEQKRLKWLVRFTTETLAAFRGVPRTFGKWAEKFIDTYDD